MLNRHKSILEMIQLAGRPVSKLELVKWAFVLSRETPSKGGDSFYEFLPFHFGPYSFSMQRDLEMLTKEGLISETNHHVSCCQSTAISKLPSTIQKDIRIIVSRFQNWTTEEVLDYVYRSYPAYTVNSKWQQLSTRKIASQAVYTAGYEGLQIDGFLDLLVQQGIQRLIDVRNNPVARRYGFHKSTLNRLCNQLAIDYVHIPELGIVSEERQNLNNAHDYTVLFDVYERTTLHREIARIAQVGDLMLDKPSVLVCMESDACRCHRSRLGASVAKRTGLSIIHLGGRS